MTVHRTAPVFSLRAGMRQLGRKTYRSRARPHFPFLEKRKRGGPKASVLAGLRSCPSR